MELQDILQHIEELRTRLIRIIATLLGIFLFCLLFRLKSFIFYEYKLYYPFPAIDNIYNNISAQVFRKVKMDLVGNLKLEIIYTQIATPVIVQIQIALVLAIILGMPMIIYQLGKFISPALYEKEKKLILKITIPATILFILGCLFSYFFLTPFTINFLYGYGEALGISPYLTVDEFISFVLLFVLAFGFIFEMPIIMAGLTSLGIVKSNTYLEYWRYAIVGIIIFSAVITPDGSGITMLIVAFPMSVLYFGGYAVSYFIERFNKQKKN